MDLLFSHFEMPVNKLFGRGIVAGPDVVTKPAIVPACNLMKTKPW